MVQILRATSHECDSSAVRTNLAPPDRFFEGGQLLQDAAVGGHPEDGRVPRLRAIRDRTRGREECRPVRGPGERQLIGMIPGLESRGWRDMDRRPISVDQ